MSRSFSPYGYNIKYRVKGKCPNQTYNYVQGAGPNPPVLTSTRLQPQYFSYLKSKYIFYIDDYDNLIFNECNRMYFISSENKDMHQMNLNECDVEVPHAYKIYQKNQIKKIENNSYEIQYDNTLFLKDFFDVVIISNDKYITKQCKIYFLYQQNKVKINVPFMYQNTNLKVLIYSLRSWFYKFNINKSQLSQDTIIEWNGLEKIEIPAIILYNLSGTKNLKFILKNKNDGSLLLNDYDISQNLITFRYMKLQDVDDNNLFGYESINQNTIVINKNIQNNLYKWNSNKQVVITHNLNGYINFIFDKDFKLKKSNYSIFYIDKNNIKIVFQNEDLMPDIFTMICFKVGE